MKIKKNKTSVILLSIISCGVYADYIVYPQNKANIKIPEITCESDTSKLEDGMYVLCSQEDNVEYPVVNGQAFRLSLEYPEKAFDCSRGEKYLNDKNKGYAYNSDARDLAILTGKNIYTPFLSFLPVYSASNEEDAKGSIRYVNADGSYGEDVVYEYSSRYTVSVTINDKVEGTNLSIKRYEESYYKYKGYYPRIKNEKKVANRACLI
jgi:hypothetical protein